MPQQSSAPAHEGWGLGLFPPPFRLLLAIFLVSACSFISSWRTAVLAFSAGLVLLLLNGKLRFPRLLCSLLLVTFLWRFVGNVALPNGVRPSFDRLLHLTSPDFLAGVFGGCKGAAMAAIGYAALSCTSIPEQYEGISFFLPSKAKKYVLCFFRYFQRFLSDLFVTWHTAKLQGYAKKRFSIVEHAVLLGVMAQAVILRLFLSVRRITFAGETRWPSEATNIGGHIVISDLSVKYKRKGQLVLKNINLNLKNGEFVLLCGPAGSGKTVLMRTLCGYIPRLTGKVEGGDVLIGGQSIIGMSLKQISRTVRYVSQAAADSILGLTVGQDILLADNEPQKAEECLHNLGIESLWHQNTADLSGGQEVRLALASVLASAPAILLLDEPLQQLDSDGRREFMRALLAIRRRLKLTVIASDRFFHEFLPYVDRCLLLRDGEVAADLSVPLSISDIESHAVDFGLSLSTARRWRAARPDMLCEVKNVDLRFGHRPVLSNINLRIHRGEVIAITGPNGSGKTTLLRLLAGALRPSKGEIIPRHARAGFLYQSPDAQLIERTVRQELESGVSRLEPSTAKVEEFISKQRELLHLGPEEEVLDLHETSIRLLILSKMAAFRDLVLVDEPSIGLDGRTVDMVWEYLSELASEGAAVLIASHDPRLIQRADRVISLGNGTIAHEGDTPLCAVGKFPLTTAAGKFELHGFIYGSKDKTVLALTTEHSDGSDCLLRVQLGCVFATALESLDCDCGLQISAALRQITSAPPGIFVYFPEEEGSGHELSLKIEAVQLERCSGIGYVEAAEQLGFPHANYECLTYVPYLLRELGVSASLRLLTNSPLKFAALRAADSRIDSVLPLFIDKSSVSDVARLELLQKMKKLGHAASS